MKPVFISEEMATFTGLSKDDTYPRPQITSAICKYIETNNLQNPQDRREFRVDTGLQKLLRYNPAQPPKDEQGNTIPMTYFRLQKYMQHHFRPVVDTSVVAPVVETPVVVAPVVETPVATPAPTTAAAPKRKAK
jgi:chromatin remodeling complex protein RSC6